MKQLIKNPITKVKLEKKFLQVNWENGEVEKYYYLWLRDNCCCPGCLHPKTKERIFDLLSVPDDIFATKAFITEEGLLQVIWSNNEHVSHFSPNWLANYSSTNHKNEKLSPVTWDSRHIKELYTVQYQEIMEDDQALLNWLYVLQQFGISMICKAPLQKQTVANLAQRIDFIQVTNFGTTFDVYSMSNPNSNAYTSLAIPLHTDLPYHEVSPGYQFLHCLENDVEGGESIFVDGFHIVEVLKQENPQAFKLLSSLEIPFRFYDRTHDIRFRIPIVVLDNEGKLVEVRINAHTTAPFDVNEDKMHELYQAYRQLLALTRNCQYQIQRKMNPGDCFVFDNRRILHARTAFKMQKGSRYLRGCYVDRGALLSRIRVLERSKRERENLVL